MSSGSVTTEWFGPVVVTDQAGAEQVRLGVDNVLGERFHTQFVKATAETKTQTPSPVQLEVTVTTAAIVQIELVSQSFTEVANVVSAQISAVVRGYDAGGPTVELLSARTLPYDLPFTLTVEDPEPTEKTFSIYLGWDHRPAVGDSTATFAVRYQWWGTSDAGKIQQA